MKGYYNKPEATKKVIVNGGWLNTGDLGYMGKDGHFYITDRKKDMIIVSGFNVYPNEIENYVSGYDKVKEIAAIGVPDHKSGECVKVYVVKSVESLTKEEVISYCRKGLTAYKIPKHVEFVEKIPKSAVGKLLRRKLREADEKAK